LRSCFQFTRIFNHPRNIRQALAALGTPAAAPENFSNIARIVARRQAEVFVSQGIADADKHGRFYPSPRGEAGIPSLDGEDDNDCQLQKA